MSLQDFLKVVADKKGLSEAELETLSLALTKQSVAEIAGELKITTEAVRKRLGEIYQKFGLTGHSRGKWIKLQQLLNDQYREHTAKKKIYIAWSDNNGRRLAEGLKDTILGHRKLEPYLLSKDISSENAKFSEIELELKGSDFGVCCLTRGFSTWTNFNVGFLLGQTRNLKLLQFQQQEYEELSGPLSNLSVSSGTDTEALIKLLNEMIDNDRREAERWIRLTFSAWKQTVDEVLKEPIQLDVTQLINSAEQAVKGLRENNNILTNLCFRQIIARSLAVINSELENIQTGHCVPAILYPQYLSTLQEEPITACVKALALINREEHFWQEEIGRKIGQSAQAESIRVFAFMKPEDFERSFEMLLEHATNYKVYAMNYDTLVQDFPDFCRDFSIIEVSNDKVLAEYVTKGPLKYARFSIDQKEVTLHEKNLGKIIEGAIEVKKLKKMEDPNCIFEKMREIRNLVFERPMRLIMKPIRMSEYLDIEDYDQYQEKHPYFQEMMERMISILNFNRGRRPNQCRILEMGAGTGLFTRRLSQLPKVEIVAIELDWICVKKLEHNLSDYPFIEILNKDSCTFDPYGRFKYICSSFDEHCNSLEDVNLYIQNVRRNLESNGLFIIGNGFIPAHDLQDWNARQEALKIYYNHIIEIAIKDGETKLALMQQSLLASALERKAVSGFKLSCEKYEELLSSAGFDFRKEKIGPKDQDDVGGVWIYEAWLRNGKEV